MEKESYITDEEKINCQKVADAFFDSKSLFDDLISYDLAVKGSGY